MASQSRPVLCRIAHPVLLVAVGVVIAGTLRWRIDPGEASLLFLVATVCYLALLERLIPYEREWHPTRSEWGWYAVYFVFSLLGGALAQLLVSALLDRIARPTPLFSLWGEVPLALLVGSLTGYLVHRLEHTSSVLWRLHGVHHVPEKVNVGNNGVNHIVDIVLVQGLVQASLALAGFSREAVFAVGIFVVAQGYFIHANIDVRLGRLNRVFASPEGHRLHHSTRLSEAGNFGSDLSIWDQLFGSFTWEPGRRPAAVGLEHPGAFPKTEAVVAGLLHPFRPTAKAGGRGQYPT